MANRNSKLQQNPHYQTRYEKTIKGGSEPGFDVLKGTERVRAEKAAYEDAKADLAAAKMSKIRRENLDQ